LSKTADEAAGPVDAPPAIPLLHHLARTGGTLIARCIGCMDGIVLLSEINPGGTEYFDPLVQAHQWFALLSADDLRRIGDRSGALAFEDAITLIDERCRERGLRLVIRDWTHLDYTGVPFVRRPAYELTLARVLAARFTLNSLATVRHPIDQWLSLQRIALPGGRIPVETFLHGCRRFAREAVRMGFVRYEDFLRAPQTIMGEICARLALPFDPGFIDKWPHYSKVTGDTEGLARTAITAPPPRNYPPELLARLTTNADYREILDMLGYEHPTAGTVS
jgi:hypothetical protein